jgi:hypothetical protein
VSKRFQVGPAQVKQALMVYGMDSDAVINSAFNLAAAQVDIQVSPQGVDLKLLGQMHYEEFLGAPRKSRDWTKELTEDAEDNIRIYGK